MKRDPKYVLQPVTRLDSVSSNRDAATGLTQRQPFAAKKSSIVAHLSFDTWKFL